MVSGKLNSYLAGIDQQAQEMYLRLVEQMAKAEDVTERLKAEGTMAWIRMTNSIRNRAAEIVSVDKYTRPCS